MDVVIPYSRGDLVSMAHERCHILDEGHSADGTTMRVRVSAPCRSTFARFRV